MYGRPLLFLLTLTTLGVTAEQRKLHRLVGGHLRIINPDPEDSELMRLEASGSREKKQKSDQDEKKTLAQQVADGKYGLIQKELFGKPQKRPGVLSYDDNSEVPNDNKENLGGLHKNEIWLAENHLLVIKGGIYPPHEEKPTNAVTHWPPIDDFKAPLHQVKIPKHPKVPPPFPVQFTDDGPLQILGTNSSRTINESIASTGYALPPPDGYQDSNASHSLDHSNPANATPWQAPVPIPIYPSGEYPQGAPFPPFPLNGTLPPYFASLPPGAAILPPPGNQSDLYDEDDPSIYYPPPYSFYYPKDNSSAVQPGPLVPGIILPPPPNFFGPLEEITTTTASKTPQRQRKPTTEENPQIHPTTTPLPSTEKTITKKPFKVYPVHNVYQSNEVSSTYTTTKEPTVVSVLPVRQPNRTYPRTGKPQTQRKRPQVTILQPVRGNTSPPTYHENEISDKPFVSYGPPRATKKSSVTTTQVPLKYFTTVNEIETNSVTQPAIKLHIESEKSTEKPIQFYFYEEEFDPNSQTTQQTPVKQSTYVPNDYYVPVKPTTTVRQRKPQFIYVNAQPYNTQKPKFRYIPQPVKTDTFSIHIAKLQNQINQYYTTSRPTYKPVHSPKPVYQFSFQAANYQQQNRFKPSPPDLNQEDQFRPIPKYSVQIQQAIEIIPTEPPRYQQTPPPVYYQHTYQQTSERPGRYYTTNRPNYAYETITQNTRYQNVATPKPISQYSFEVTPNPIYQGFYTKPDEGFFDDNTKKYFTMFGRKLPSSTSPLPSVEQTTVKPNYIYSNQQQQQQASPQYHEKPISLESDTLVNYVHPRPTTNPDAELIPVNHPQTYPNVVKYPVNPAQYVQPQKLPHREENPEIIKAIPIEVPSDDGREGSFISYQLPGDRGAHFYFLTPQLTQRRDQGSSYYYSQPNASRIRRNEARNEEKDKER
ncbi:extensin-2 [Anoplophora glabripennis]|uniref:extensin-2 n=1 Tax=Anoplophora glabripennis TaxID=217634 RepID=UPI000874EB97|nr:extensin-2 [Anoplophora glabripennis]